MNVIVYSKPGCVACDATKRALDRLEIDYTEIDVMVDHHAAQRLREMGSLKLPRVEVTGPDFRDQWVDFRPTKIEELKARLVA